MRALRWAGLLGICCALGTASAAAQASLGVAGLMASLGGDDFEGVDNGFGGEASVWFRAGTSFTIGGGAHYTSHGTDIDENLKVLGIFAEPRYRFAAGGGNLTPYIAGRAAWARYSIQDASATGFYFGGGGGLMIGAGKTLIDIEVLYNSASFGDVSVDGSSIDGTDASGSALVAKVGVIFRLGGGGGQ